ncbi:MAG: TolC family protein [Desulfobacula sp.]|uniref:TolC family protein n=1 Tax=Desulfobacula sp. TaxID=2593537 RepID=UPI0025C5FCA2|nr:TolC family protein [Desulfobacula sp.]MCD4721670.1 TolC family protein [Desulfobacula sp.]
MSTNKCAKGAKQKFLDMYIIKEPDLKIAGKLAFVGNLSLAAGLARVRPAKQRVLQASSAYWPRIDARTTVSRVSLSDNDYQTNLTNARFFNPNAAIDDPEEYYKGELTATWVLFNGFEGKFSTAAARYGEGRSKSAQKNLKRLLLSSVAGAYFAAQLALENIAIAKADEVFNQQQLMEAKARRRVGSGSLSDELNFKVRVNSAKAKRINAEKAYEVAMFGLAAILGVPGAVFPANLELAKLEHETPEELFSPVLEPHITYAQSHRPDVLQKEFSLKQTISEIKIARAKFFPTVSLLATMEGNRAGNGSFENEDFGHTVALVFEYNFFAGGANRAKLREAKAKQVEVNKAMEDVRLKISSQVRASLAKLNSARKELVLQRSNADLVRQNRNLVEKEYAAGLGSLVRLNEAQRDFTAAQSRLALVSLRHALYNLETDTGRILISFADY